MTVTSILKSVRVWGIRGVMNYLHRLPVLHRLAHSDRGGYARPGRGITLIGPFSIPSGLSQCVRHFAIRLAEAGIPHQTFDTCDRHSLPKSDYADLLTPRSEFDLSRYDHVIELFASHAPKSPNRIHSVLAFWEFESGIDYAVPEIHSGTPLIGMSDFNVQLMRGAAKNGTPVHKILYPLVLGNDRYAPSEEIRRRYRIPGNAFVCFFNFDYGSSYYRKNPEAVVRAFARAFPSDDGKTALVLKSSRPREPYAGYLRRTIAENGIANRVILIEESVSQPDMTGLLAACDVYLSLHRGEGFGIGMAEAMSLGKPVIATDYSASTEFCRAGHAFPVPYKMIPVPREQRDIVAYAKVESWADADVDAAAERLRELYRDPQLRARTGAAAKEFVRNYFSVENFKESINQFLDS